MTSLATAAVTRRAGAEALSQTDEDLRNLRLIERREGGRLLTLITPRYLNPEQRLPLVVFLHGLGETNDERAGAYAWLERYGLGSAWQRLKRAPLARTSTRGEWTDDRLVELNRELEARPFRGFVMACPSMPNPRNAAELDAYTRWLEESLLPCARRDAQVDPARTLLCGVSLGGWVSLEVLVRRPHLFGAWAGVQTAISTASAAGFATKIAAASDAGAGGGGKEPRRLLLLTSTQDHWRASSEALAEAFRARSLAADYRVVPGPHDQPWLREAGTIETVVWLDRVARGTDDGSGGKRP